MLVVLAMHGGYVVEHGNKVANGQWSLSEVVQSSTWRELKAVRMVLELFQSKLKNERVRWFTDNQNVVRIVQYGSKKPSLQAEALGISSTCASNNIRIEPEWIPREQNDLADYYSRIVDYDDWMLNPLFLAGWILCGAPTLLIVLLTHLIPNSSGSIQGIGHLDQRLSMPLHVPGWMRIIGGVPLFI